MGKAHWENGELGKMSELQESNSDVNGFDHNQLQGCIDCPYHRQFNAHQMTDFGMMVSCRADKTEGLTPVAENHKACIHFKAASRL